MVPESHIFIKAELPLIILIGVPRQLGEYWYVGLAQSDRPPSNELSSP